MKILYGAFLVLTVLLLYPVIAAAEGRVIRKEVTVSASLEAVWDAWTTNEGAETWFAPKTNIDPTVGGHYEIFFFPDKPYGWRGGEGLRVHSLIPMKSLAVTWSAPWEFGVLRSLRTIVFLRFEELGPKKVKVHFTQLGWGEGEQWDKVFDYFTEAWDIVLGRLKYRFANGPIDWDNPYRPTASLSVKE
jgi:uncharacterized protein YndB with AHSA1/START domain